MKACPDCKSNKTLTEFGSSSYTSDGLSRVCLVCNRKEQAEYRKTDRYKAYIRAYDRKRYIKNRKKYLVKAKVARALRFKKIIKPLNCVSCDEVRPLEGHHEDYDKPLDLLWLCNICHKHKHGRIKDLTLLSVNLKGGLK